MKTQGFARGSSKRLGLALAVIGFFRGLGAVAEVGVVDAAAIPGWRSIGPAPGALPAPVVANAASGTIYMGALSGPLLKSSDGGSSFAKVDSWPDIGSFSIAMDPARGVPRGCVVAAAVTGRGQSVTDPVPGR